MNELTIGPGDETSLSMETLMGDMERGGAFTGDFEGRCRQFWRRMSLASEACWGTCGVVD